MLNEVFGLLAGFLGFFINENIFSFQNIVLLAIGLFWLVFASVQDFKHREVENWWTFSLIIFVLAFRAFFSIETDNWGFFLWGVIGLIAGFIVADAFYYSRMFAGGDAKMLMALGAILFLGNDIKSNLFILALYLLLFVVCGSIYGMVYSFILTFKYLKDFKKSYKVLFKEYKKRIIIIDFLVLLLLLFFVYYNFQIGVFLCVLLFVCPFMLIYAKSLEDSCMKVYVKVSELTIGDWLAKPLKIKGKKMEPYWEGLGEEELEFIQKNYSGKVLVKQGIPFIPAFLFALIALIMLFRLL